MKNITNLFNIFQHEEDYFNALTDKTKVRSLLGSQFVLILCFLLIYGIIMGSYNGFAQSISSAVKLPALIFLTLLICFPAFYVIQFMIGSKMTLVQMLGIVLSGFIVFATIAVSFATIVLFFMITGDNYAFIKLLHVAILLFSGIFAMRTIIRGLKYACEKQNIYPKLGLNVFKVWIIIFAFVGTQLSWNLRPFIGSKDMAFELFREKEGNFYLALVTTGFNFLNGSEKENNIESAEIKKEQTEIEKSPAKIESPNNSKSDSTQEKSN